jgi:hypothetical protein
MNPANCRVLLRQSSSPGEARGHEEVTQSRQGAKGAEAYGVFLRQVLQSEPVTELDATFGVSASLREKVLPSALFEFPVFPCGNPAVGPSRSAILSWSPSSSSCESCPKILIRSRDRRSGQTIVRMEQEPRNG